MALGLNQPLTEMSTRNISWGVKAGLTTLPPSSAECLEIWEPQTPGPSEPVHACNGIALPLHSQFRIQDGKYEGWNFNSGNYLFTTDTK